MHWSVNRWRMHRDVYRMRMELNELLRLASQPTWSAVTISLSDKVAAQRKPANMRSVNGDVWKSTLKCRWPQTLQLFPALLSLCFCLQVSPGLPAQEFFLSACLIGWWQLGEGTVGQWCSCWETWKYFSGIHIKMQMLLLSDTKN